MEQGEKPIGGLDFQTKSPFQQVIEFDKQYLGAGRVSSIMGDFAVSKDRLTTEGVNTCVACAAVGDGKAVLNHSLTSNVERNIKLFLDEIPNNARVLVVGAAPLHSREDGSNTLWKQVVQRFNEYRKQHPDVHLTMYKLTDPKLAVSIGVNAKTKSIDTLVV